MKHITALHGENVEFYVKAGGILCFKGIVMTCLMKTNKMHFSFLIYLKMELCSGHVSS